MAKKKEPDEKTILYIDGFTLRGICDDCNTLEGMAKALEKQAARLRAWAKDGVKYGNQLYDNVFYMELQTSDPKLIKKYKKIGFAVEEEESEE
jgi:hypothetical protein